MLELQMIRVQLTIDHLSLENPFLDGPKEWPMYRRWSKQEIEMLP